MSWKLSPVTETEPLLKVEIQLLGAAGAAHPGLLVTNTNPLESFPSPL
jgi:hypothetical protein